MNSQIFPIVCGGLALASFFAAIFFWSRKSEMEKHERLIRLAPEDRRAELVLRTLNFFSIDEKRLTRAQQYELAMRQITERASRFRTIAVVITCLFASFALVTTLALLTSSALRNNVAPQHVSQESHANSAGIGYPELDLDGKNIQDGQYMKEDTPPGTLFRDCAHCPIMVVVPPGQLRGQSIIESNTSSTLIEIPRAFAVAVYETRFHEWDAGVDAGALPSPKGGIGADSGWGRGNRPVINVSFSDALLYVEWLNRSSFRGGKYRLLTEAEWEYVARAGSTTAYSFGDIYNPDLVADGPYGTEPVGTYEANLFGVYDMHGNVWEWTSSCWLEQLLNQIGMDCGKHVIRGGSWGREPEALRSDSRLGSNSKGFRLGFRVARDLP